MQSYSLMGEKKACVQKRVLRPGRVRAVRAAFVALMLLFVAAGARADTFNITFSGGLSGTGSFTTDGVCLLCFAPAGGLLTFTASLGADSGPSSFDLSDDNNLSLLFDRLGSNFAPVSDIIDSETGDLLGLSPRPPGPAGSPSGDWAIGLTNGTYRVSPAAAVPEPSSVILLVTGVAMVGFLTRRKLLVGGSFRRIPNPTAQ